MEDLFLMCIIGFFVICAFVAFLDYLIGKFEKRAVKKSWLSHIDSIPTDSDK